MKNEANEVFSKVRTELLLFCQKHCETELWLLQTAFLPTQFFLIKPKKKKMIKYNLCIKSYFNAYCFSFFHSNYFTLGLIYTVLPPRNLEWTILAFLKGQTAPALPTNYFKNIH